MWNTDNSQKQITIITDKSGTNNRYNQTDKYFFSNFDNENSALKFISSLETGLKVHKIYSIDIEGKMYNLTVGFNNGRLALIKENQFT